MPTEMMHLAGGFRDTVASRDGSVGCNPLPTRGACERLVTDINQGVHHRLCLPRQDTVEREACPWHWEVRDAALLSIRYPNILHFMHTTTLKTYMEILYLQG